MKNIICPHCNSDMVESNFDYDCAIIRYECQECDNHFTEHDINLCEHCGEQCTEDNIKTEQGNFCSYDCWREFTNK